MGATLGTTGLKTNNRFYSFLYRVAAERALKLPKDIVRHDPARVNAGNKHEQDIHE